MNKQDKVTTLLICLRANQATALYVKEKVTVAKAETRGHSKGHKSVIFTSVIPLVFKAAKKAFNKPKYIKFHV